MPDRRLALTRSLPPLALLGFAGAWLTADYFRVGAYDTATVSRGALLALGTLSALFVGVVACAPRTRAGAAVAGCLTTAGMGALVEVVAEGLTTKRVIVSRPIEMLARDGVTASLAFIVPAVVVVLLARKTWGRPRSLAGGVAARSLFALPALSVAIGTAAAVRGCSASRAFAVPLDISLALGSLATLWLATAFGLDVAAYVRGRRAAASIAACEPGEGQSDQAESLTDFGIGDGEVVSVERADAYRALPRIVAAVRGDAWLGMRLLRDAFLKSGASMVAASVGLVAAYSSIPSAPLQAARGLDPSVVRELDSVLGRRDGLSGSNRIPVVCETYFTMAGGCVDRLPSMERMATNQKLEGIRESWVSGDMHPRGRPLEQYCLDGLEDLLREKDCTREPPKASWAQGFGVDRR